MNKKPKGYWRIEQMQGQLGSGIRGALAYIGASQIQYAARNDDSMPNPSVYDERGWLDFEVGLCFKVNGRSNQNWKMAVTLESNDTYTVRLFRKTTPTERKTGKVSILLDSASDAYDDNIKAVVEHMYDEAIKKYNNGLIRIF